MINRSTVRRAALLIAAIGCTAAAANSTPDRPAGFDHAIHEGKLAAAAADELACLDCHQINASGRLGKTPGHATCFGRCHGPPPARKGGRAPLPKERRTVCAACHPQPHLDAFEAGERTRMVPTSPYGIDPDFAVAFSHRKHVATTDRDCRPCHLAPGGRQRAPARAHSRCERCHRKPTESAMPAMTACEQCHRPGFGSARGPRQRRGPFPVSATFSHKTHLKRAGRTASCLPCHQGAATAEGDVVPSPTTADCTACHDGKQAFSPTQPRCRACHTQPADPPDLERPERTPFRHVSHATRGLSAPCSQCHQLADDGAPLPAAADHLACSHARCHASEFTSLAPKICGACHTGFEPWRPLHYEPPQVETEFSIQFSHRGHLTAGPGKDRSCESCHQSANRGHKTCTGGDCHNNSARDLRACASCHRARSAAAPARRWSVAARFRHQSHQRDARGTPLACDACHIDVAASEANAVRPPAKATCAPCHNGKIAFKMTGHHCARCHGPAAGLGSDANDKSHSHGSELQRRL